MTDDLTPERLRRATSAPLSLLQHGWRDIPETDKEAVLKKIAESISDVDVSQAVNLTAHYLCAINGEVPPFMVTCLKMMIDKNPAVIVYNADDYSHLPISKAMLTYAYDKAKALHGNSAQLTRAYGYFMTQCCSSNSACVQQFNEGRAL